MKTSEQINEIAKALSLTQSEVQKAHKSSNNPFYKSKYADLDSSWDACRESLCKNGLSIVQTTASVNDKTYLLTRLMHSSGQWIESRMELILGKRDMQQLGAAITYGRRQHLQAIVGISPSDDDGNSLIEKPRKATQYAKPQEIVPEPEKDEKGQPEASEAQETIESEQEPSQFISQDELTHLIEVAIKNGWGPDNIEAEFRKLGYRVKTKMKKSLKLSDLIDPMTTWDYETLLESVSKKVKKDAAKKQSMV